MASIAAGIIIFTLMAALALSEVIGSYLFMSRADRSSALLPDDPR